MIVVDRRTFLYALPVMMVSLSGCQSDSSTSAGSLVLENRHDLPHVVELEHITFLPDGETRISEERGQVPIDPMETRRYDDVFDPSLSHVVVGTLPSSETIRVPYGREGTEATGNLVFFEITTSGVLNGGLRSV